MSEWDDVDDLDQFIDEQLATDPEFERAWSAAQADAEGPSAEPRPVRGLFWAVLGSALFWVGIAWLVLR